MGRESEGEKRERRESNGTDGALGPLPVPRAHSGRWISVCSAAVPVPQVHRSTEHSAKCHVLAKYTRLWIETHRRTPNANGFEKVRCN